MRRKAEWFLISALGVVLVAGTAWSLGVPEDTDEQGGPPPAGFRGREPTPGMMPDWGLEEQLGLSDEQVSKLRALGRDAAKAGIRTRSELAIQRMELEELLEADEPDRAAIDRKLRQLSEVRDALQRVRIEHRLAFRQVLTPEQRTKARTLLRQRLHKRFQERGPMRHHGPRGRSGFGAGPGFGPGGPPLD